MGVGMSENGTRAWIGVGGTQNVIIKVTGLGLTHASRLRVRSWSERTQESTDECLKSATTDQLLSLFLLL